MEEINPTIPQNGINRETIKYFAVFTMILNHVANILLEPKTLISDIFVNIGYFTAVTMCYFLVEGYHYTRSKKKYAIRLLIFGIISQIPFSIAIYKPIYDTILETKPQTPLWVLFVLGFNMIISLLLCFGILAAQEKIKNPILRYTVILLLILLSKYTDWAYMAPIYTLMFSWAYGSRKKLPIAYLVSALAYPFVAGYLWHNGDRIIDVTGGSIAIIISGIVIMFLYNGKCSRKKTFSKWFFYVIYPLHLIILCFIRDFIL